MTPLQSVPLHGLSSLLVLWLNCTQTALSWWLFPPRLSLHQRQLGTRQGAPHDLYSTRQFPTDQFPANPFRVLKYKRLLSTVSRNSERRKVSREAITFSPRAKKTRHFNLLTTPLLRAADSWRSSSSGPRSIRLRYKSWRIPITEYPSIL